eukprot:15452349-Alexandrium_andersonii.AAC.1
MRRRWASGSLGWLRDRSPRVRGRGGVCSMGCVTGAPEAAEALVGVAGATTEGRACPSSTAGAAGAGGGAGREGGACCPRSPQTSLRAGAAEAAGAICKMCVLR